MVFEASSRTTVPLNISEMFEFYVDCSVTVYDKFQG